MPTIIFHGPELERDKKRELISTFTETASRLTGIPEQAFTIYLMSTSPEDVGVGGKLLAEREQENR
jgi:4-oxalocrotonate tautomerase